MVVEPKFLCPKHSEAKQTETFGVWSRERFIAGPINEENQWLKLKRPEGFQERSVYRQNLGGGLQGV